MKLAIVGAEDKKWNGKEKQAKDMLFKYLFELNNIELIISGGCPNGGVDIWSEEYANKHSIPILVFKPVVFNWVDGYKKRNIQIAEHCDTLLVFSPTVNNKLVWNGGEWTADYAEKSGKKVLRLRMELNIKEV